MADSVYDISVRLGLDTVGLGGAAALAMRAFGDLEKAAIGADSSVDRLGVRATRLDQQLSNATVGTQRYFDLFGQSTVATAEHTAAVDAATAAHGKLNTAMGAAGLIAGGVVAMGIGGGILGYLGQAVDKATQLQTVMIGIGQRLTDNSGVGLTGSQQLAAEDALTTKGAQIGLSSGMSKLDVASIIQAAEGAGITSESKLMTMMGPLTNLAEVLKLTKGIDPSQSATVATQFAHLFGAYGDKKIGGVSDTEYMTNLLTRALFTTPTNPSEFLALTSQFVGPMRTLYGSKGNGPQEAISQSIETAALLARLGQETRGGTQFAQIVSRIAGTGRGRTGGLQELKDASGVGSFFNAQGQLTDIPKLVTALAAVGAHKTPQEADKIFFDAFGTVGTRLAGLLADPATKAQLGIIATELGPKGLPSEKAIQQQYNQSRAGQLNQASKNMEDLEIALGNGLIPMMTALAKAEVGITKPLAEFANQHQTITGLIADVAALAGTFLVVGGALAAVKGIWTILNLAEGISKVADAFGPALAAIRAFSVAETAAAVASTVQAAAMGTAAAVADTAAAAWGLLSAGVDIATASFIALDIAAAPFILPILAIVAAVGAAVLVFTHWHDITHMLGDMFSWMGGKLHDFLTMLGLVHDGPTNPATTVPGGGPGATGTTTNNGQKGHWVVGGHGARHWIPATGGGGPAIQVHIEHVHGATPQTVKTLAREMGKEVAKQMTRQSKRTTSLTPVPSGM